MLAVRSWTCLTTCAPCMSGHSLCAVFGPTPCGKLDVWSPRSASACDWHPATLLPLRMSPACNGQPCSWLQGKHCLCMSSQCKAALLCV